MYSCTIVQSMVYKASGLHDVVACYVEFHQNSYKQKKKNVLRDELCKLYEDVIA